ncbi:hypothetical protein SADUNF_Sadunf07G0118400 [Salix dunnii]|uniref:Uncharacterized protein n=1 Tax=Salix dunnii TaxID=1413687 RepID=A0A835K4I9_9ROSI|nr:hypothetical protein SADUNF_Sadunf07G0118400 [Salix dunnii]
MSSAEVLVAPSSKAAMALLKAESMVRIVGFLLLVVSGQAMAHQIKFNSCKICIENVTTVLPTRIRPDRIGDLTVKCNTGNSFAISEYMDCNREPIQIDRPHD